MQHTVILPVEVFRPDAGTRSGGPESDSQLDSSSSAQGQCHCVTVLSTSVSPRVKKTRVDRCPSRTVGSRQLQTRKDAARTQVTRR
jgi:hypothetical protein